MSQNGGTQVAKAGLQYFEGQLKVMLPRIGELLPRRAGDPHRFVRMVVMACVRNPKLLTCDRTSLLAAVMNAAELGLSCSGGPASRAHLVPFKGKVQCIPDYKGLIDIALDSGKLDGVEAENVYEKDLFTYRRGTDPKLEHVPVLGDDRGEIIATYAIAWPKGGGRPTWVVMARHEVDAIRDKSPAYQYAVKTKTDTPWISSDPEMRKKSAIRRLYKWLPTTSEMQKVEEADVAADKGELVSIQDLGREELSAAQEEERVGLLEGLAKAKLQLPERVGQALAYIGYDENASPDTMPLDALRAVEGQLRNGGEAKAEPEPKGKAKDKPEFKLDGEQKG